MKTAIKLLAGIGLLAFAGQAYAQDERNAEDSKLRNDPTYSTHNYKHPNKAATARRWEDKTGVAVGRPSSNVDRLANYKRQVPNQQPAGGITVNHTPSTDVADRNYKIQRPSLTPASDVNVVRKRQEKPEKGKPTEIAD
ncbi:hypothetical protein ACFSUS_26060 [Spirosoma soli]|uniref:Uncharacterized protein n=1 Tax=Spirosoma soli TaxID=1770529 RepID=A0ABW5MAP0_9BACT